MRITVVHAHPSPNSFSRALFNTVIESLDGHDLDVCNLYDDGFDPVLSATEHRDYLADNPERDQLVARYISFVERAEAIVFVYPTWWAGLPAILKGWFERVLVPGVAFALDENDRLQPQMGHVRRLAGVTTYGSSRVVIALTADGGRRTISRTLRVATGFRSRVTWLGLHRMDTATADDRTAFLACVRREFSTW
jgi:putative NADPH-quinone reductase